MLFGGALKYKERGPVLDEDGNECYTKAKATAYLYGGRPVPLELMIPDRPGWFHSTKTGKDYECDKYLSGKRVGEYKTKQVDVRGELKTKLYEKVYTFPRMVEPLDEWATKNKDANGNPVYSTGEDTVEALERFEIPFIKKFVRYSALTKEITTYYRATGKNGEPTGMLTLVQPWDWIIHHNLHHTSTVTSRLSSSNPNLQNVPRKDKSKVKKLFVSRFGKDGFMIEADYSQLEVVGQGVLSKDENLRNDLRHKVDFHCKRVAARFGCTYEEAVAWCKNEDYEDYALWKGRRTDAKVFSFQRAYGAGAKKISLTTGIPVQDVQAMIEAEEKMYPGVVRYNEMVARTVEKTARPFYDPDNGQTMRRGYYQAPTGTLYSFRSYPAPSYLKREGIMDSFMPTELKNYPVQGTSGEFVQAILGKLVRHFINNNNNYGGKAFLVNTVHDCIWVDCHKDVLHEVGADVKRIMESIPELFNDVFDMGIDVPFPVEVEYGPNMYDLHHLQ